MIWFNLIIPIIAIVILLKKFGKKMAIWEYVLVIAIPIIVIMSAKAISVHSQTADKEALQFQVTEATYYEAWSSWVDQTCTRQVASGTDSKGNTTYTTEYYDCSYCDDNPEYWEAIDNAGNRYRINSPQFELYASEWEKRLFVDKRRDIDFYGGCGEDGDAYTTDWNGEFETIESVTKEHTYRNVLQASNSVFNFAPVDSFDIADYNLYEYPAISRWNYNPILGSNDIAARERLQKWNAKLGLYKQVNMIIAVYHDQPVDAAHKQEDYWQGGNKNEVILCIGERDGNIDWTYVSSWTETDIMKIKLRDAVQNMEYSNMSAVVDTMASTVQTFFIRKEFSDFDYIKVHPSLKATMITFIITILLTVALSIFVVMNDFTFDNPKGNGSRSFRRRWR